MTSTLEQPTPKVDTQTVGDTASGDICATLNGLAEECSSRATFYRAALTAVAEYYGSPYVAVQITQSASMLDERVHGQIEDSAIWKSAVDEVLLESQVDDKQIARLYTVEGTSLQVVALAVPICDQTGLPIGSMSVIVRCDDSSFAPMYLGEFAALASVVSNAAKKFDTNTTRTTQDDSSLKRAVVKASDFQSLHELAFAVTNSLKNKFGCDQVTLGLVEDGKIRVMSISGLDNVYPRSPGVKKIRQAMEECLDHGDVICCQTDDTWAEQSIVSNHCLHRAWHAETGNAPVASLPLLIDDMCVAVLSIIRDKSSPFSTEELTQVFETVTPFAPAMMLVAKADRGLLRHATDSARKGAAWLLAPRSYQRKAIGAAILAGIAYFCLATTEYQVTTSSQIAPTEVRIFAAPFEGTISDSHVEVGDAVEPGDLLYEMDTTDLQLQRDKLESDLEVLRLRVNQALTAGDAKSAALSGSEMRVNLAQLAIIRHNLAEAQVHAASKGIIVSGELSQRIGEVVPMGTPLIEFVPKGDWSVELLVPENSVPDLKVGLVGQFACNARPGEILHCKIVRIRPSSEPRDGRNVFIANATVEGNPEWMRAGMKGVARMDVGKRRLWWVTLHRVIDYVHLAFWI